MLFYQNYEISRIKFCVLIIVLFINNLNIKCDTILSIRCNRKLYINGCPFNQFTRCNKQTGYCQCKASYPILLSPLSPCLNYKGLNQECIHSSQCNKTLNAVCYDKNLRELNGLEILKHWFIAEVENRHKHNYKPNNWGKCMCKSGYNLSPENKCQKLHVRQILCNGSHDCMNLDLNSHCDGRTRRCNCDAGFSYDTDLDRCVVSVKKFGDSCNMDAECVRWDSNTMCGSARICTCRQTKLFYYDLVTQRCKIRPFTPKCRYGYSSNEYTGECLIIHGTESPSRSLAFDKYLEMIIVFVFFVIMVFILRYWRSVLPASYYANEAEHDSYNRRNIHRNRRRSRATSLGSPRIISLRVNLDSSESIDSNEETVINVNTANSPSASSLPPYEFPNTFGASVDSQPPPYSDAPPTYEEAIAMKK